MVVEGITAWDPVPFLGDSQLVSFLYVRGHQPPPFPGPQHPEVVLYLGGVSGGPYDRIEPGVISEEVLSGVDSIIQVTDISEKEEWP